MPLYMTQFGYTPQAWSALAKNPADRRTPITAAAEKVGAHLVSLHYCMGEYDGVVMIDAPDDTTAVAVIIAAVSPGHISRVRTTRLMEVEEAMEAMRRAGTIAFPAPSGD
jgi:uncharacterized protein with GYD domain